MRSAILTITNDLGLHARAAAQLVQRVSGYHSRVTLKRIDIDRSVDARSILAVLTLAAAKGTIVEIIAEGEDEVDVVSTVSELFGDGFGENNV